MTRINVVPPQELSGKHLVAEYRELPRIFKLVHAAQARGETPASIGAPVEYTLGKGHVKFFYSRLGFVVARQRALIEEMIRRGYKPSYGAPMEILKGLRGHWFNDYLPDDAALAINRQRILDRAPRQRA